MANRSKIQGYFRRYKLQKRWQKMLACLSAVVVFCTTYALILPAITLETKPVCGLEEHAHSEACYTMESVLICGQSENDGHIHSDGCYSENTTLVCGLEEQSGHTHSDSCYSDTTRLVCGLEENEDHTHTADCYEHQRVLICGQEERSGHSHGASCYETTRTLICEQEEQGNHKHSEECYQEKPVLTCQIKEHKHTEECLKKPVEGEEEEKSEIEEIEEVAVSYGDTTADLESQSTWEQTMKDVKLTGDWNKDILLIADSQLGYTESTRNYLINESGEKKGYTRYGEWYGVPYGDWCAMFASFCVRYTGIPEKVMPISAGCQNWIELLNGEAYGYYYAVNDKNSYHVRTSGQSYTLEPGDLIFYNWDSEPDADHVGIIYSLEYSDSGILKQIRTIEGNTGNRVAYRTYSPDNNNIMGYAKLPKNPDYEEPELTELKAETDGYEAMATFDNGTLPYGSVMQLTLLPKDDERTVSYIDPILQALSEKYEEGSHLTDLLCFDITFLNDAGEEIEPEGPVNVSICKSADGVLEEENKDSIEEATEKEQIPRHISWELVHITSEGNIENLTEDQSTTIDIDDSNELQKLEFTNDGFSVYAAAAVLAAGDTYYHMTGKADAPTYRNLTVSGTNGQYVHPTNLMTYQVSSHSVSIGSTDGHADYDARLFLMTEKKWGVTTWTPNSTSYATGQSNYVVAYCGDYGLAESSQAQYNRNPLQYAQVTTTNNVYPDTVTGQAKYELNEVVLHCYPFVSAEEMIAAAGLTGTQVSESELLLASQIAIWRRTNPSLVSSQRKLGFGYGTQMHTDSPYWQSHVGSGYVNQLRPVSDRECNWNDDYADYIENDTVKGYVYTLLDYLDGVSQNAGAVYQRYGEAAYNRAPSDVTIEDMQLVSVTANANGTYTVQIRLELNRALTSGESLKATLTDGYDASIASQEITLGRNNKTITLNFTSVSRIPETIRVHLKGTSGQVKKVFYYVPSNVTAQHMIGADYESGTIELEADLELNKTSVSIQKIWEGGDPQNYPDVMVQLYQNGEAYQDPVALRADSNPAWYYRWGDLPKKDEAGHEYVYTVAEISEIPGFEAGVVVEAEPNSQNPASHSYQVTNKAYEAFKTSRSAIKTWSGDYTKSPVTVNLIRNGEVKDTQVLNEDNRWFYRWDDLPMKDENGIDYEYDITENVPGGYTVSYTREDNPEDIQILEGQKPVWQGHSAVDLNVPSLLVAKLPGGDKALANVNGKFAWVDMVDAVSNTYAQWTFLGTSSTNGYNIQNVGNPNVYIGRDTSKRQFILTTSKNTTFYNVSFYYTDNRTNYYLTGIDSNGNGNTSTTSTSGLEFFRVTWTMTDNMITLDTGDVHYTINNHKIEYYDVPIIKVNKADPSRKLSGAVFDLYKTDPASTTVVPGVSGVNGTLISTCTTDSAGQGSFQNLESGMVYYLVESTAPDGFSRMGIPISFVIQPDGSIQVLSGDADYYENTGLTFTIKDAPGITLPHTGGTGTITYTMAGLGMILLGLCLMYIKIHGKEVG